MDLESAKKVPLNRITHSVRASQAVLQYGVGAMIDFPNQTLMTAAPEYWQEQVVQIHDERLEKVLRVDYFGLPGMVFLPQMQTISANQRLGFRLQKVNNTEKTQ